MPPKKKTSVITPQGSMMIEILSIDTRESRKLYSQSKLNPKEKSQAQDLLKDRFFTACAKYGGRKHTWNGDGGFAFFQSNSEYGQAVEAAKEFLLSLRRLNTQTASVFDLPKFDRSVRVTAHRGEIFLAADVSIDSADPINFDDFIKAEKKFAPEVNELFITFQMYSILTASNKKRFEKYSKVVSGSLATDIYRLKTTPVIKSRDIFKELELSQLTESEWTYLASQIYHHQMNVAARNEITKGLIKRLGQAEKGCQLISSEDILELTLNALYSYLFVAYPDFKFRVNYWRYSKDENDNDILTMIAYNYPEGEEPSDPSRSVLVENQNYKVCRAFFLKEVIVTPCVVSARNAQPKQWYDLHNGQKSPKRHLSSSMQIPVYYLDDANKKVMQGVLCLDSDKTDMFLDEEKLLWTDDLIGYLVNISLSEKIHQLSELFVV